VVKLVDTLASGASDLKQVLGVRLSPSAQNTHIYEVKLLIMFSTIDVNEIIGEVIITYN
jgi:hypothetical protein